MYEGYLELGGVPLINAEATEAYLAHLKPGASLRRVFNTDRIHIALEDAAYRTPVLDQASWVNPLDPATHGFYGLYPISVEGIDGSTLTAPVTEYLSDGGSVGFSRDSTREIRVSGLLVGADMLSAHAGLTWLSQALRSDTCVDCNDGVLRYFVALPDVCETGAFGEEIDVHTESFGDTLPGVFRYRFQPDLVMPGMPMRVRWEAQWSEGAQAQFGSAPLDSIDGSSLSEVITPLRRNYLVNPQLRLSAAGWSVSGSGSQSWLPSGGVDDGTYLALAAAQPTTPSPAPTTAAESLGVLGLALASVPAAGSGSGFGQSAFGTGAFGAGTSGAGATSSAGVLAAQGSGTASSSVTSTVAAASTDSGYGSGTYGSGTYGQSFVAPTPDDRFGVSVSTVSTVPIGPVAASLALRSRTSAAVTVSIVGAAGPLASVDLQPGTDWQRFQLVGTNTSGGYLSVVVQTDDSVDVDQAVLEVGSSSPSYFDGASADPGYVSSWDGAQDASVATMRWTGLMEVVRDDSQFRPVLSILSGVAQGLQLSWGVRQFQTMSDQRSPFEREMLDVRCSSGPQVTQSIDTGSGGGYLRVEFVLTAGNPAAYSTPQVVNTTPLKNLPFSDPDLLVDDADLSWLSDPNSIVITRPPSAPVIVNPAIETITSWRRYYVAIPATAVADWAESVPTVGLTSKSQPITQVRVRFHPNPFRYPVEKVDPTSYCSEFVVSYLPAVTRLEVDGTLERALASRGDRSSTPADHLLYGAAGAPISWPKLSCAIDYVMTIDVPPASTIDAFDVDLALRKKQ